MKNHLSFFKSASWSLKQFLIGLFLCLIFHPLFAFQQAQNEGKSSVEPLQIATFDVDAAPPVGDPLTYDSTANGWDLGLRAKGIVLTGAGQPIVLCAVDWIGIANESQDAFKSA